MRIARLEQVSSIRTQSNKRKSKSSKLEMFTMKSIFQPLRITYVRIFKGFQQFRGSSNCDFLRLI